MNIKNTFRPASWWRPASGLIFLLALVGANPARAEDGLQTASTPESVGDVEHPGIEVIGITPLPSLGVPLSRVPANVQSANASDLQHQQTLDLADFMNQNFNGVFINETQANPFQPDVNYRGFTASPLLGAAAGLSVYVDGVRVNESFGDVVNWDLIPESAISSVNLIPGSNPVFGLNTLGGALSIQTKSGAHDPGTEFEAYGGSFGRSSEQFTTGGALGQFDYFLAVNNFDEDGWRDDSPSHVRQLFAKTGWENATTDFDFSYAFADTNLTGNGLSPASMLAENRASAFTVPDNSKNHLNFVNARGSHFLGQDWLLSGNVYFRQLITRTYNGDLNDDYESDYLASVAPGGDCATAADPDSCAAQALADETATNNRTQTVQRTFGFTGQSAYSGKLLHHENQLTAGLSYDCGRDDFTQSAQQAELTASRGTPPTGPEAAVTSLYGTNRTSGAFFTDTFSVTERLHLTASGRYNDTREQLEDRLGTGLDGSHGFRRFNPALGLNYTPSKTLTFYGAYNEGSRSPTPIELGCSNPDVPCQLPNAFASDPDLKQVVAKTFELGARGSFLDGKQLAWSAAVYRTTSDNDIQFISSSVSGAGYFDNVGKTRRQGFELGLHGDVQKLHGQFGYAFIDATYRTPLSLVSADNSAADANGFINVVSGDKLPEVPRSTAKLVLDYAITPNFDVGSNLLMSAGSFVRGDENNQHQQGINAAGDVFDGGGRLGAYALLNLDANYHFLRH